MINKNIKIKEKLIIDKKDIWIMSIMTLIYLIIALYDLGSLSAPKTSWIPAKPGENIVIDFGVDKDISRITYYNVLGNSKDTIGKFNVEYLNSEGTYSPLTVLDKANGEVFRWKFVDTPKIKTSRIKIIAELSGAEIGEIGFFDNSKKIIDSIRIIDKNTDSNDIGIIENLFDEQNKAVYKPSFMNSTYFDEIYHARTAYETIHRIEPYEWTHPPLGKELIAIGISIFGMNAFGWRIIGTIFGVAMIPLMYLFGKKLFNGRFYAFCAAYLMMFDFMHFTQTRISTIDVYVTFFVILMFYHIFDYFIDKSYIVEFKKSLRPLFLSGLFFGLGASSKWIALYGAVGIAFLIVLAKYNEFREYKVKSKNGLLKKPKRLQNLFSINLTKTVLYCIIFFVIIPGIIYLLSYIPFMMVKGLGHGLKDVFTYQIEMYDYHSKLVATHPYSSKWWEWPIMSRPLWAYAGKQYYDLSSGRTASIYLFGNPAVWWIGIITVFVSLVISICKKEKRMIVVFIAIASQYLPWILVPRLTFIYHYFSIVPFVILTIVYVIKNLLEFGTYDFNKLNRYNHIMYSIPKYIVYIYLLAVPLLFILFYPLLSGLEVNKTYITYLKWIMPWAF